ncbi:MAG: CotH kinase family protein [Chitinispirillia bacterium]|nr:CotH kinase family protein [Chitinispirillia bacterium]
MASRNILILAFISIAATMSWSRELISAPIFSHNPGIYQSSFNLSITHPNKDAIIRYTTNGSEPNDSSQELPKGEVIEITDRTGDPNVFSMIRTTPQRSADPNERWAIIPWREPVGNVTKGTIIRAAAFKNGSVSESIDGSFFVFSPDSPYRTLPLVSIIVDSMGFFGHDSGIYVPGNEYKDNNWSGNYYMRGDQWERRGNFQYFDLSISDSAIISQTVGYRINGGWTRRESQKSLRVYARGGKYGAEALDFKGRLFHYRPDTSFRRLLLRQGGNDFQRALIRDASAQYMISHIKSFDTQAFRSVVVFLNGEFWGWHNIRERQDKHYLSAVYGVDLGNIDLFDLRNLKDRDIVNFSPKEGDAKAYEDMVKFARENNLADSAALDSILKLIDIDSYLDYYAIQMFFNNTDGIYNNHRIWRERVPFNRYAPVGRDGRFRWLVNDLDQIMDIWQNGRRHSFNDLFDTTRAGNELFINLMENEYVKQSFINRFADLMNSAFLPQRSTAVIDSIAATLRPVMDAHIRRWNNPRGYSRHGEITLFWENELERLKRNYRDRPNIFRNMVRDHFYAGLSRTVTLESDTTRGFIKINSITVDSKLPGTSSQIYPWSGTYFANIPITVSGVGKPNYRIQKWIVNGTEIMDSVLTIDLSLKNSCTIEAVFAYVEIETVSRKVSRKKGLKLSINHNVRSRPNVTFDFTLPENGNVQLIVYNSAGEKVLRLVNSELDSGSYKVIWRAENIAPGVYTYKLKTLNKTLERKLNWGTAPRLQLCKKGSCPGDKP